MLRGELLMRRLAVYLALTAMVASSSFTAVVPAFAASTTARDVLQMLTVAPESTTAPYDRSYFRGWYDADGDGCNTRLEVLIEEATVAPIVSAHCELSGGEWFSKYDNAVTTDPSLFDIDHLVPLKEAWVSGASSWTKAQRDEFANDLGVPYALIAVSASSNRSKSDQDPAEWMPEKSTYHCTYATEWVLVKYRWGLTVDNNEHNALAAVLTGPCGSTEVTLPTVMAVYQAPAPTNPAPTKPAPPAQGSAAAPKFTDIHKNSKFKKEIEWLATSGVTTGYADGTFRPHAPITRDAMAAFMYRLAGKPSFTPPKRSAFTDITPKSKFYKEIMWLSSTGITTGYADGTFRPYDPVTRDAMAAFMYRLAGKPAFTAPKASPFRDMTTKSQFYRETSWLAATGVSTGWADGTYRPFQAIERNAMAAFMYRFQARVGTGNNLVPKNPGDIKNCADFKTWREAQAWYNRYFPYYGDVARLDGNNDGWVCVSLPGAP